MAILVPGPDFPTGGAILGRVRHPLRLHDRSWLDPDAYAQRRRSRRSLRKRARGDHRHRDPLPDQQVDARSRSIAELVREKRDRGHLRPARRVQSRGHAHRHRAQARCRRRRGAEPALALHGQLQSSFGCQYDRAERRPPAADDPASDILVARSSTSARRSSPAAPSSCLGQARATPRTMSRSASPSRWPTSTR